MRYAVVSDIHANLESLTAVLAAMRASDTLLCLGDIVGYGPNPNECVALVRDRARAVVLGNHDLAAVEGYGLNYFNPAAREALKWTQSVLAADHVAWLNTLGYDLRIGDVLLVHGAPVDYFRYILDKTAARDAFSATDAPLIFVGHTHIAESYALSPDGSIAHSHFQTGGTVDLVPGTRYIINVGSVGQPRDLNPEASFALYDDEARTIQWLRVPYAIAKVQEKIAAAHLPHALATRLEAGR